MNTTNSRTAANPFRAIPTTVIDRKGRPKHWHNCPSCTGASHAEIAHCDVCSGNGYVEGTPVECGYDECEIVAAENARHDAEEAAHDAAQVVEAMPVSGRFDLGAEIAMQASAHALLNPLLYGRGGK